MRILIAYDGSESADKAVELVANAPLPAATELRVVSAYQPIITEAPIDAVTAARLYQDLADEAERLARAASQRLERPGLGVSSEATMGRSADVILGAAEEFKADLVVAGSRGRGVFTAALLGSVSEELIDHAPCPVVIARTTGLAKVVLADDGSPDARAAADLLTTWPVFSGSQIRVVSVAEPVGEDWTPTMAAPIAATQRAATGAEHAEARLQAARLLAGRTAQTTVDRLRAAGLAAEPRIRQGDPAVAIVAEATDWPADLIAVGTRGQTGLPRLLRGSVARKVLQHAPCSVLIQRQR